MIHADGHHMIMSRFAIHQHTLPSRGQPLAEIYILDTDNSNHLRVGFGFEFAMSIL